MAPRPTVTDRLIRFYGGNSEGSGRIPDIFAAQIDVTRVPELVGYIDAYIARLRELRHQLVTLAADDADTVTCNRCSTSFVPRRRDQRFCSNACRQAAYRNARKA